MEEVRFDRMTPRLVRARREAFNLAYLPVGTLEWHGAHMPFGTDYLTVTHVAEEAARRFGGVVFPPLYYGDVRYILVDCKSEWRPIYAEEMGVPESYAAAFPLQEPDGSPGWQTPTQPDDGFPANEPLPFTAQEQMRAFSSLIAYTTLTIHLYGFRNILLMSGHGSNDEFCRRAEEIYRQNVQRRKAFGAPAKTKTCVYFEMGESYRSPSIHGDKWEASVVMAGNPGIVRLDFIPNDPNAPVAPYPNHPTAMPDKVDRRVTKERQAILREFHPCNASAEYGKAQTELVLKDLGKLIADLMRDE